MSEKISLGSMEKQIENESIEETDKYLLFHLGGEEYGIHISDVQTIEEMQEITAIPDMPLYVKGIVNLRGNVISLIDLRLFFSMENREYDDRTCVIIVRTKEAEVGLVVDTVSEVREIPSEDISEAPELKSNTDSNNYLYGLGKVGESVKVLIDSHKLIDSMQLYQ